MGHTMLHDFTVSSHGRILHWATSPYNSPLNPQIHHHFPWNMSLLNGFFKWGNSYGQSKVASYASGSQFIPWENKQVATNLEEDQEAPEYHAFEASCASPARGLPGSPGSKPSKPGSHEDELSTYLCMQYMDVCLYSMSIQLYIYINMYVCNACNACNKCNACNACNKCNACKKCNACNKCMYVCIIYIYTCYTRICAHIYIYRYIYISLYIIIYHCISYIHSECCALCLSHAGWRLWRPVFGDWYRSYGYPCSRKVTTP